MVAPQATTQPAQSRISGELASSHGNGYTPEEEQWLEDHYNKDKTPAECATHLGRTVAAIGMEVSHLRRAGRPIAYPASQPWRAEKVGPPPIPSPPDRVLDPPDPPTLEELKAMTAPKPKGAKKPRTREEVLETRVAPSIPTVNAAEHHFAEGSRRRSLRATLLPDRETCPHFRLSGEAAIRGAFPEFFDSYRELLQGSGMIWEVCVWCGDVQQVSLQLDANGARTTKYTRVAIPEHVREKYPLPTARLLPAPEPKQEQEPVAEEDAVRGGGGKRDAA
jgi:hypothetical protein